MKTKGLNQHTKKKLRDLMAGGYTPEEISSIIRVELECVESWVDYFTPTPPPKSKKKDKEED